MTLAKICGVTTASDASAVAALGADYLGLNFAPRSPRCLHFAAATMLAHAARAAATAPLRLVGIFVDATPADIVALARAGVIDIAQLHGDETPSAAATLTALGVEVWKASTLAAVGGPITPKAWASAGVAALVIDAAASGGGIAGGSGARVDWRAVHQIAQASPLPLVLAGGLAPDNVGEAIATAGPWCVDVASGVEAAPGAKDLGKVAAFLRVAHGAAR